MRETVLVAGDLGGAGSWIVDRLRGTYDVVVVDRTPPESDDVDGVDFRAVDPADQGAVRETVIDADPTAVVHVGTVPREEGRTTPAARGARTTRSARITRSKRRDGPECASCGRRAGPSAGRDAPAGAAAPVVPPRRRGPPRRPVERVRDPEAAGETTAERVANAFDVPVAPVRPSRIQYPGEYAITPIREEFSPADAGRFGDPWSYADICDVVDFVERLLTAESPGHAVFDPFAPDNFLGVPTAEAVEAGFGELPDPGDVEGDGSVTRCGRPRGVRVESRPLPGDGGGRTRRRGGVRATTARRPLVSKSICRVSCSPT